MKKDRAAAWVRPRGEIEDALRTRVSFLRKSMAEYDAGDFDEGARIAAEIFMIVHDGQQRSLLTQLALRSSLQFVSYAPAPTPGNLLDGHPLILTAMGSESAMNLPVLDRGPTPEGLVKFHKWWEREVVLSAPNGQRMTRKNLIYALRNQDGGGHVDARLTDEAYVRFSRTHPNFLHTNQHGVSKPVMPMPHLPTVRHIGFELERTLVRAGVCAAA